ncbi:MAG: sodium-dependent bicarbonate transport family permease [Lautropia sp.]|nr:sodium-dependent bicarbonate transport family permease [Lautropia sp.]
MTASRFDDLRRAGPYLVGFGIVLPIVSAAGGVLTGWWLSLSLGVTFPFNVLAGVPLYHRMALLMYRGGGQAG